MSSEKTIYMTEAEVKRYLTIKMKLIELFLCQMPKEILDISYEYNETHLTIQLVLLEDYYIPLNIEEEIKNNFDSYIIDIKYIYLKSEVFNSNKGSWLPAGYEWLPHILYSKAEIL